MKLSKNLSLRECTKSITAKRLGIDNTPSNEAIENLRLVAANIFQPCRDYFSVPIYISSGYRSDALNRAVGGSKNSQHVLGQAIDVDADFFGGKTNLDLFNYFLTETDFDQLIWEFGDSNNPDWVHVSYKKEGNRNQPLKAIKFNGKTEYIPYLT